MTRDAGRKLVVLLPLLLLFSCKNGVPTGQVVAIVDGDEITVADLQIEMGQGAGVQPGSAQQAALQRLITRKLLVKEAERRKLDDTPQAALARARAEDLTLVQLLQSDLSGKLGQAPSEIDVDRFVTKHQDQFAQHQLISVDRLLVSNVTPALVESMKSRHTLPEMEALLSAGNVPYVRSAALIDSLTLDPEVARKITGLGPDAILVLSSGTGTAQVLKVSAIRTAPLDNDGARNAALQTMARTRSEQVRAAMAKIIADGRRHLKTGTPLGPSGSSAWH